MSDFEKRLPSDLERFKKEGVVFVPNTRTHQQMPLFYQFAENFMNNRKRLDISTAANCISIPFLIVHGTNDEAVPVEEARNLNKLCPHSQLLLIAGGGHTFGAAHPFLNTVLPDAADEAVRATINFFKENV